MSAQTQPTTPLDNSTGVWINRTEIRSETSNRIYIISQHRIKRHWSCSCPAGRTRRACKHLRAMGLPEHEVPFELQPVKKKSGFLDVYDKTYDPQRERSGNPNDWRIADRFSAGRIRARARSEPAATETHAANSVTLK